MLNFEYYAPTKVIFGKATETVVGQESITAVRAPDVPAFWTV